MEDVKSILQGLKVAMSETLHELTLAALADAHSTIINRSMSVPNSPNLHAEKEAVGARFVQHFGANFDALTGVNENTVNVLDYASLKLVEEDDLEAIIAMEGMISHARNCDIPQYYKFNTRLDTMLFGTRIDESNNPMDPEQIGEAFKEALRPVGLPATNLLIAYRNFNSQVFHNLESVLEQANDYLISRGILADLDVAARDKSMLLNKRNKQRQKEDPTERAFRSTEELAEQSLDQQQLFPLVQKLLHRLDMETANSAQTLQKDAAPSAPLKQGMMVGTKLVEIVSQEKLLGCLDELAAGADSAADHAATTTAGVALDLRTPLGNLLEAKGGATSLCAVDSKSADIIKLVTMLYEAISQDATVPIPIKELIGRTQITTLKTALIDPSFFDTDTHPVRVLLNELAAAGITWTQPEKLEKDPMYQKIKATITELITNFSDDFEFVRPLIEQFREFKKKGLLAVTDASSQLGNADERGQRLDEVQEYALLKIRERILDQKLHADVRKFLEEYFLKFLVQVILREGPGGISWRPVMNTVDVLLWTVQTERQKGDLERFIKVSVRLRTNLAKALDVGGIEKAEAGAALKALSIVQNQSFKEGPAAETGEESHAASSGQISDKAPDNQAAQNKQQDLPKDDEHLQEVDQYVIGLWFEFQVEGEQTIKCTLAAKIETIEKYVFVNNQGVKVIEKSRMGLARELKAGTVKVICHGPLIDRAMEAVIAQLRQRDAELPVAAKT